MSQYPQNTPPSPVGYSTGAYGPPIDPLAPAKRAGIMMIVLGSLGLLCGTCVGLLGFMPLDQILAQQAKSGQTLPPGFTPSMLTWLFRIMAALMFGSGIIQLVLGIFVRRGSGGAAIAGIAFSSVVIIYFVINTFFALSHGQNAPMALFMGLIAIGVMSLQVYFLVQAKQASGYVAHAKAAYEAQYWQYVQQQQTYQQPGFQAAAPAPIPPPPAYGQGAYNAPAMGGAGAAPPQTGWQWPPPPPPGAPVAPPPPPAGDSQDAQGPQG